MKEKGHLLKEKGHLMKEKGYLSILIRAFIRVEKGIRGSLFQMEKGHLYVGKRAIIRKEKGGAHIRGGKGHSSDE